MDPPQKLFFFDRSICKTALNTDFFPTDLFLGISLLLHTWPSTYNKANSVEEKICAKIYRNILQEDGRS
jgi:hypothetical protein